MAVVGVGGRSSRFEVLLFGGMKVFGMSSGCMRPVVIPRIRVLLARGDMRVMLLMMHEI
jgi:hypothetical protein